MTYKFSALGVKIIIDVAGGAVHIVDDMIYDIIEAFEAGGRNGVISEFKGKYPEGELIEGIEEIERLSKEELLFTKDSYEELLPKINMRAPVVKALCLHVAHDCNLRCVYCFAGEGEYHGDRSLMSFETGKAALDFLIKSSGSRVNLEVDFFGGEPLMNFDVVKQLVAYGRKREKEEGKNFRFTITTNGVLLDEGKMEFINENMVNVVLSLDGRKEIHDRMRPAPNKSGSYDVIVPKFKKMVEKRKDKDYYVRGTFTGFNKDFSNDVIHIADLGFKEISVEPVVAPASAPYALKEEDIPYLSRQYELLAEEMLKRDEEGNGFNFFHFNVELSGGPCVIKRMVGCGSGTEYLAVTPSGDLYPCHQFVGMDEFKMGTVFDGVIDEKIREDFLNTNIYTKEKCKNCWARFYCSGGCTANAYLYGGDLSTPYALGCELQKKRLEYAIALKARKWLKEED